MSELEVISGGLGFAELKEKADAGNKEALQVMRDYIAKKEQIVEFIEKKEMPENEWRDEEFKFGDEVYIVGGGYSGRKGTVENNDSSGNVIRVLVFSKDENGDAEIIYFNPEDVAKNKPEKIQSDRLGEIELLDLKKYEDYAVGDIFVRHNRTKTKTREILGFSMPDSFTHEEGLKIVFKYGDGDVYTARRFRFENEIIALVYKKVEKP